MKLLNDIKRFTIKSMEIKTILIGQWTLFLGFCIEFGTCPNNIFVYITNKKNW